jgi:hypothetical protein
MAYNERFIENVAFEELACSFDRYLAQIFQRYLSY